MVQPPLHFVLFPFMAPGHMIPMVDIARLMAQRGVTITIITTPLNANRFKNVISRSVQSGLPISLVEVKFPHQEVGLPEGHENIDLLDSEGNLLAFFKAANFLGEPVEKLMEEMNPRPSCIIADMCLPYTSNLAKKFKIPKIVFHGMCSFSLLCMHVAREAGIFDTIESEKEYVSIPDLPDRVEFTKPQIPLRTYGVGDWTEFMEKLVEADNKSYGVIMNTFQELEPAYVREYKKAREGKVWTIGPVSLCNKVGLDKVERGNKAAIDQDKCLKWLDSREPSSVLYICLGSLCNLPLAQLKELGLALEESNRPFVWVIRGGKKYIELQKWISESGFEERIGERGLLVKGWAPQMLILSHSSVGGFLTHCGWNSTLEGITVGVPLLTWPLFAEQFCNEKLVVQILKTGVRSGMEVSLKWSEEEQIGVSVDKDRIKSAIDELMGDSVEAKERRRRAKELGELANKAVGEGGSSHSDITLLIQDITQQVQSKN
ncbi:PREDICTED: UDP-glycosyltransferase 73C1-like [Tarenaya hassleriana]|uniref:UDP-glycosyltransferase 73C1-like n=1 Tax=Tarenaya hassleriana TaxID=28532 RepID=UPI00053C7EE8|nr:PREDICTED: UDP-glycosyltransferase 73C1-like [Tarenaya hassleriana]